MAWSDGFRPSGDERIQLRENGRLTSHTLRRLPGLPAATVTLPLQDGEPREVNVAASP